MAVSTLMRLPCEILRLIGKYLNPIDLENYLVVLTTCGDRLVLADFTTVVTKDYSTLPDDYKIQLEASKTKPIALTATRLSFKPDRVELTLVNAIRHGPAKFYLVNQVIGQGNYVNGLKQGYWYIRQNYDPDLSWCIELDYSESGDYHQDQRQGIWTIQGLNSIKTPLIFSGDLTELLVIQTRAELEYQSNQKSGPGTFVIEDMVVSTDVKSRIITGTQSGYCREDKLDGDWFYVSSRDPSIRIVFSYVEGKKVNFKILV